MTNQYHAGQKYTREQKEQLDAAFSAWIDAENDAENAPGGVYSDEGRNLAALILSNAYDTLRAGFDTANKPQGNNGEPLITSEWQPGDDALAEQAEEAAYMHSHPANGWGL